MFAFYAEFERNSAKTVANTMAAIRTILYTLTLSFQMAKSYSKKVVLCGDLGPDYTKK
jgi:hypothetical protein